jgi:hypothetical protein
MNNYACFSNWEGHRRTVEPTPLAAHAGVYRPTGHVQPPNTGDHGHLPRYAGRRTGSGKIRDIFHATRDAVLEVVI